MKTRRRPQTPPEEIANSLCHGLAFLAIVSFYPALLTRAPPAPVRRTRRWA